VYPDVEELFSYDYAGNRIYRKKGSLETTYSYDTGNRLIEKIEGSEQTRYSYDSNGNLITESGRQGTISYTYDCFNRTERVRKSNGEYIRNFYDPEGLRSKIEENGRTVLFVYSGRDIVAELDGEKLRAASIRGHELLMQRNGDGEQYYYLNNVHGDVTALVDGTGAVVNRYQYDAFGNTVEAVEKVQNRFRYAGEQYDQVTGQYYLRARFYNPVVGRFTQEDTYRGDGLNLYSYVQNNPINYVDLSGYAGCSTKSNTWNEFQKANKGKYASTKDASEAYKRLVVGQSPWPDGFVPVKDVLKPGTMFEMALAPKQIPEHPGGFGTFDRIKDEAFVRNDLAVKQAWKPKLEKVATYEVVKDVPVNLGPVGPQIDKVTGRYLPGGASQLEMLVPQAERMNYLKVVAVRDI